MTEITEGPFLLDPDYADFDDNPRLKLSTLTGLSAFNLLLFTLLAGFITGVIAAQLIANQQRYALLRERGIETVVRVTRCDSYKSSADVDFTYQVADVVYTATAQLEGRCTDYAPGTKITAVYLADDPGQIELLSLAQLNQPLFIMPPGFWNAMVVVFGLGAALTLVYLVRLFIVGMIRMTRLNRHGQVLTGQIMQSRWRLESKSRRLYIIIEYEFRTPQGQRLVRAQEKQREDMRMAPMPERGTPVRVVYADDDTYVML